METKTSCDQARYIDFSWNKLYDVTTTQHIRVAPVEPELALKVTNKTDSVMTIAGATFAITVDGKEELIDVWQKAAEKKLLPDQPHTFTIRLPRLDKLGKVSSVSFAVYDLVSGVDAAGRPSAKSRFEWAYQVAHEMRSETVLFRLEEKHLKSREDWSQCIEARAWPRPRRCARALRPGGPAGPVRALGRASARRAHSPAGHAGTRSACT